MTLKMYFAAAAATLALAACNSAETTEAAPDAAATEVGPGQGAVKDDVSEPNILNVAIGSANHSTLVAAVKAASLVDALANAGPFTVFAPVNTAFDALPEGTVDNLLKPENKEALKQVLLGHVTTSSYSPDWLTDGMTVTMVDEKGSKWTISNKDGQLMIGDAKVLASVKASNGYVHVIDKVLLAK